MKSKLVRILGVVAVVAMLAAALVSPVSAMSGVSLAVGNTTVSLATPYLVTFTLGSTQSRQRERDCCYICYGHVGRQPRRHHPNRSRERHNCHARDHYHRDTTIAGQVATINTLNGPVPIGTIGSGAVR